MELGRDSDTGGQVIINQQIKLNQVGSNLINKYIYMCVCIFR